MSDSRASGGGGATLKDTKNTTGALQRTRMVMERNLNRMDTAIRQVSQDGELIKDSLDEHAVELKGALRSTKTNLNTVKSAEVWERYSLKAALAFFFATVFYIVCKRTRILALCVFALTQLGGGKVSPPAVPPLLDLPESSSSSSSLESTGLGGMQHSDLDVQWDEPAAVSEGAWESDIEREDEREIEGEREREREREQQDEHPLPATSTCAHNRDALDADDRKWDEEEGCPGSAAGYGDVIDSGVAVVNVVDDIDIDTHSITDTQSEFTGDGHVVSDSVSVTETVTDVVLDVIFDEIVFDVSHTTTSSEATDTTTAAITTTDAITDTTTTDAITDTVTDTASTDAIRDTATTITDTTTADITTTDTIFSDTISNEITDAPTATETTDTITHDDIITDTAFDTFTDTLSDTEADTAAAGAYTVTDTDPITDIIMTNSSADTATPLFTTNEEDAMDQHSHTDQEEEAAASGTDEL